MTDNVEDGEPPNGDESQKAKATGLNNSVLGGFARTTAKRFAEYKSSAKDGEGKPSSVATVPTNRHSRHDWLERLFDLFGQYAIEVNKLVEDAHLVTTCERPSEDISENPLISPLQGCVSTKYWQLTVRLQADGIAGFLLPMSMEKTFLRDESLFERIFLIESPGDENAAVWSFDNKPVEFFQLPDLAKRFFGSLIEIARMEDISDLDAVADQTAEQYAAANLPPVIPDLPPIPSFEVEDSTAVNEAKFKDLLTHASTVASNTASGAAAHDVAAHRAPEPEQVSEPILDLAKLEAQAESVRKSNKSKSSGGEEASRTLDSYALLDFEDADTYYNEMRLTPAPEPLPANPQTTESLFTRGSMPPPETEAEIDSTFESAALAAEEARMEAERAAEKAELMAAAARMEAEIFEAAAAEDAAVKLAESDKLRAAEEARAEAVRALHLRAEEEAKAEAARVEHERLEEEAKIELARIEHARLEEEAKIELVRIEHARLEAEARAELARVDHVRLEEARTELARGEQERLEEEAAAEAERVQQVRLEAEAAAAEAARVEQAKLQEEAAAEAERVEQARLEQEAAAEAERAEQARLEQEAAAEAERAEQARLEQEVAAAEAERAEQARLEQEAAAEAERAEQARLEQEAAAEAERAEQAKLEELARLEAERVEQAKAEEEAAEAARAEQARLEEEARAEAEKAEQAEQARAQEELLAAQHAEQASSRKSDAAEAQTAAVTDEAVSDHSATATSPVSWESAPVSWEHAATTPAATDQVSVDNQAFPVSSHAAAFEGELPGHAAGPAAELTASDASAQFAGPAESELPEVPPPIISRVSLPTPTEKSAPDIVPPDHDSEPAFPRAEDSHAYRDDSFELLKPSDMDTTAATIDVQHDDSEIADALLAVTAAEAPPIKESLTRRELSSEVQKLAAKLQQTSSDLIDTFSRKARELSGGDRPPAGPKPTITPVTASSEQPVVDEDGWRLFTPEQSALLSADETAAEPAAAFSNIPEDSEFLLSDSAFEEQVAQAPQTQNEQSANVNDVVPASYVQDQYGQVMSTEITEAEELLDSTFLQAERFASENAESSGRAPVPSFEVEHVYQTAPQPTPDIEPVNVSEIASVASEESPTAPFGEYVDEFTASSAASPAAPVAPAASKVQEAAQEPAQQEPTHPPEIIKSEPTSEKPTFPETFRRSNQPSSKKFQPYSVAAEAAEQEPNKVDPTVSVEKAKTFFESLQSMTTQRHRGQSKQEPVTAASSTTSTTSSKSNNPQEISMPKTDEMSVVAAIEMMRHSVERELENVAEIGARAFQDQDMNTVERAMKRTLRIREFKEQLMPSLEAWNTLGRED